MSVGVALGAPAGGRLPLRLALLGLGLGLALLVLTGLAWLVAPAPPVRSPFGMGLREAAPGATGLAGWLLAVQSGFSRGLNAALTDLKAGGAWTPLAALGFAYGVFHAAGPGHGKAVIAGYIVAGERTLRRGLVLSLAAALTQALVAIALVGVGTLLVGATAAGMARAGNAIETAGFAAVMLLGLAVAWAKSGRLAGLLRGEAPAACGPGCDHGLTDAERVAGLETWRARLAVVLAAGLRPCAGAVLVLVFSAAQGILWAGVAATLAMALGTALTTGALAALAVFAKRTALRLAAARGAGGLVAVGALELLAASFVAMLGLALLCGIAVGVGG